MNEQMTWREMRDNPGALAAWMLQLVDSSPDRLGIIEVPRWALRTDEDAALLEEVTKREYDRAKADRPNLSISVVGQRDQYPDAAALVAVHEHRWHDDDRCAVCDQTRPLS